MRTRGQPFAATAARAILGRGLHAILLVGPASVGKTTLAVDLAAALVCSAPDPEARPCGECRGCRLVASGNHPDVHRLAPEGPGGQVRVEQVRRLAAELALLPVEGGARVAIVEAAHRLNEDAQNALLKVLEEPPAGVTLVLCADDEERLLPTVRSRCVRVRLGPVSVREIEALLGDLGLADAPRAARLARLADGRPGLAVAYARSTETALARAEVARSLVDLASAGSAARLVTIRELLARAMSASGPLEPDAPARGVRGRRIDRSPGVGLGAAPGPDATNVEASLADAPDPEDAEAADGARKASAAERRRAAGWLIDTWRSVARDLAVVEVGERGAVRDVDELEQLETLSARLPPGSAAEFLASLERAGERLESNASPELLLDVLAIRWPHGA